MRRDREESRHSSSIYPHSVSGFACQVCSVTPDQDNYRGEGRGVQLHTNNTGANRDADTRPDTTAVKLRRREEEGGGEGGTVINHQCDCRRDDTLQILFMSPGTEFTTQCYDSRVAQWVTVHYGWTMY